MSKTRLTLLAVVAVLAAGLTASAFADDGAYDGDIQGTEQLHVEVVLTATTNAPTGATGQAEFDGENDNGTNSATLQVEVEGLAVGTYTVSVTDNTGTNTFDLGSFDVSSTGTNQDDNSQADNNDQGEDSSGAEFALPSGVNPLDIASMAIADGDGADVLIGDFTVGTETGDCDGEYDADVDVTDGDSSTNVVGSAQMVVSIKHGTPHGKFLLTANGLPAKTKLTVLVNGAVSGVTRTDKGGSVKIKNLRQKNLLAVKTVVAQDANQNVLLKAKF